ncbi:MAG: adenylate/guanylate cyclase domain-containing protein [Chloroflexota bacterium]
MTERPGDEIEAPRKQVRRLQRQLKTSERRAAQLEHSATTNARLLKSVMSELDTEKMRSETLLRNILPQQIIKRLSDGEQLIADRYREASVIFSDFEGFTAISSDLEPRVLVESLNAIFSRFDALSQQLGVEKIKTIGDAYLAVAGVPVGRPDHAAACAQMALGMIDELQQANVDLATPFRIRIGIATGPVVAGVIGTHKYVYDIWGDTVNLASRLETSCEAGRIQISERTASQLGDMFVLENRGSLTLKGKGDVIAFYLTGRFSRSHS